MPSQKTRDVVECHAKPYPMPGYIWCAALSDFTPAAFCPSMSMKIAGYRIMATGMATKYGENMGK